MADGHCLGAARKRQTNGCTPRPRASFGQWLLDCSGRVTRSLLRLSQFMHSQNPYASPSSIAAPVHQAAFSPDHLPLILTAPPFARVIWTVLAILFAAISVGSASSILLLGIAPLTALTIAALFGFCSYAALAAFFAYVVIDQSGIRMRRLRSVFYAWDDIQSWQLEENTKCVYFLHRNGKRVLVCNAATTSSSYSEVAAAFAHFVRPAGTTKADEITSTTPDGGK